MNFIKLILLELRYHTDYRNKYYQFVIVLQPFIFLTLIYFMIQWREITPSTQYIVAVGLISTWSYVLYSSGVALIDEKWRGTLEYIITSQTSIFSILLIKTINNAIVGSTTLFITYVYAVYIYSFEWNVPNYSSFLASLLVLFISLVSLGTLLAVIFIYFDNVYEYQNLILYPITILSGVFYPVTNFPILIQYIANCLPMTWAIRGLYDSINKGLFSLDLYYSLGISLSILLLSYILIVKAENKIKNTGKIGVI